MARVPVGGMRFLVPMFAVQFLSWGGMFALWVFALPHVRVQLRVSEVVALQLVGIGLAVTVALGALMNFILPVVYMRMGKVMTHAIALVCAGFGLLIVASATTSAILITGYVLTGLGWGSISSTPYGLVSERVIDGRYELAMARFNLSVVIPQICIALGLGKLVEVISPTTAIAVGGFAMLGAAAASVILLWTAYRT